MMIIAASRRAIRVVLWRPAAISVVAVAVGVVVSIAGCGSSGGSSGSSAHSTSAASVPTIVITSSTGAPSSVATSGSDAVVWGSPGEIQFVLYGSSTCPKLPETITSSGSNAITVKTAPIGNGPCTSDLVPTTSTVKAPLGIDATKPVQVTIDGESLVLAPI